METTKSVNARMEEMLGQLRNALETLTAIYDRDATLGEVKEDIKMHQWRLENKAWRKP